MDAQKLKKVRYIKPPVASKKNEFWAVLKTPTLHKYYISTKGRVYSCASGRILKGGTVGGHTCIDFTFQDDKDMPAPTFRRWGDDTIKRQKITLQRLVATTFIIKPSKAHDIVTHLNQEKKDNRVSNLRWVKPSSIIPGKWPWKGPRRGKGEKLVEAQVREIKKLLKNRTLLIKDIAALYKVSTMQIYRIQNGDLWKDVPGYTRKKMEVSALPDTTVRAIKKMLANNIKGTVIAKKMGVTPTTVSRIRNNKYYRHVT